MNSQTLGGLASDQKIENVFRVFGYSIPIGKDGRRMWPTKFKREMAKQMMSGKLTVGDVQKTCRVSDKTAYRWKSDFQTPTKKAAKRKDRPAFVEVQVNEAKPVDPISHGQIKLKRGATELTLPTDYPVKQLALLIRALDGKI
ncbi:hypothetical protein So717_08010 [Roseobacter cerasinus]|uniref:Transposase n=1 Tax=Roseobacter cerasinus TaxID=2602289 RepID=A0A640VKT3_9RHOB|nr:transposase [Roseobacter cerasinus]GFE49048.1 hypothetical protein So717_08010 [Roseobacter cerasinus]